MIQELAGSLKAEKLETIFMDNLWIDVKIPYEPGNKLAYAYNRAMENTQAEWVLFLDHDLFICNPHWYKMCLNAIRQLENKKIGWITAKCNRISGIPQKVAINNDNNDVINHINIAKELYRLYGNKITETNHDLSGFFILTNKTAWQAVGGFKHMDKTIFGIDNEYRRCLAEKEFGLYVMEGLYLYHLYKQKKLAFEDF